MMVGISKNLQQVPLIDTKNIDEISPRSIRQIIGMEVDDITAKQLLEIAGRHYKLVYELGNRCTSKERRIGIMEEI